MLTLAGQEEPLYYSNYDLETIVTPIKVNKLVELLETYGYNQKEVEYLRQGFTQGFDIEYQGPENRNSQSNNIPLRIGNKTVLWNKLMKEVQLKRVAGPYKLEDIPFKNYIQSPIGLVPKDGNSGKTRLIFHLSYDFANEKQLSVNKHTPPDKCSVKYNDLDHAVSNYLRLKPNKGRRGRMASSYLRMEQSEQDDDSDDDIVYAGKSDVQSAFRLVLLNGRSWRWLLMKAQDPKTGEWMYFIDKCLPFGASISCAIFQRFSNALRYLTEKKADAPDSITNYLDDFLFLALTVLTCNRIIAEFLHICSQVGVPIADDKTVWGCEWIIFLRILLDGKHMVLRIPMEKRDRAIKMLKNFIQKRKATIKELQELCGYLNFLCKAVFPGRPFLRRMYAKYSKIIKIPTDRREPKALMIMDGKLRPHHHVHLDQEFKSDCQVWLDFLDESSQLSKIVNRPMIDLLDASVTNEQICFYSDASAGVKLGYGCLLNTSWIRGDWGEDFMKRCEPSIEYLELFALVAGLLTWSHQLQNCHIIIFCDNQSVCAMVNNLTSSCKNCMVLLRMLTLDGLKANRRVHVNYISTWKNELADALSRNQMSRFCRLGPHMNQHPSKIAEQLWPIENIWLS